MNTAIKVNKPNGILKVRYANLPAISFNLDFIYEITHPIALVPQTIKVERGAIVDKTKALDKFKELLVDNWNKEIDIKISRTIDEEESKHLESLKVNKVILIPCRLLVPKDQTAKLQINKKILDLKTIDTCLSVLTDSKRQNRILLDQLLKQKVTFETMERKQLLETSYSNIEKAQLELYTTRCNQIRNEK